MSKIAACIVTYNRLNLLKPLIESIKNQSIKPDRIYVVNNASTDGTQEWLCAQKDLYVISQDNLGGAGGQYTATKTAYNDGFDYIWIMDDDVLPDQKCLEFMLKHIDGNKILAPMRYMDNKPYINDCLEFNLSNPFKSIWKKIISYKDLDNKLIKAEGITFEGPLFPRSAFEKCGFPEKEFFIYADDSELFIRMNKLGFPSYIVTDAILNRMLIPTQPETVFSWKTYYVIRNIIAVDILHAKNRVKYLRPWFYLLSWLTRCRSVKNIKTTLKAFYDGINYKSSNNITL